MHIYILRVYSMDVVSRCYQLNADLEEQWSMEMISPNFLVILEKMLSNQPIENEINSRNGVCLFFFLLSERDCVFVQIPTR